MKRVLMLLAAVLVVGIAAIVVRLVRSVPPLSGTESLPGLGATVRVRFDTLGNTHIQANSDVDAFRALGYLHARERLWQMETLRRSAFGRLSEVFGAATVPTDRFLRSLDIARAADRSLPLLPEGTQAILDAYLADVNCWIAASTRPLPPEFQVLRVRPEPWTRRDVVGVGGRAPAQHRGAGAGGRRRVLRPGRRGRSAGPTTPAPGFGCLREASANGRPARVSRPAQGQAGVEQLLS